MSTMVRDEYSFLCMVVRPDGTKGDMVRISVPALRNRAGLTSEEVRDDREDAKRRLHEMLGEGALPGYRWSTGW